MKVLQINTVGYGSTGKIAIQLCEMINDTGGEGFLCVPNGRHNKKKYQGKHIWIGGRISEDIHLILSRITGLEGCFSIISTFRFLKKVEKISPDVIHLHNLHNSYINLFLLFNFIKRKKIPVVWTLHDCWSLTGHCPHFTMEQCDKWQKDCYDCPLYKEYPASIIDNSKYIHKLKKICFLNVDKMVMVTPSKWLKNQVEKSFLKDYPKKVINNGIDLELFKPMKSNVREKYDISPQKKVIIGVAFGWTNKKGLDVFIELANRMDSSKYVFILVGTDDSVDKKLPSNIISIHRTSHIKELIEIYSAADLFVNPSREETFPTVNIEAIACGTPVLTFNTGGSPEIIDEYSGKVVAWGDTDALMQEIESICETKIYDSYNCMKRAEQYNVQEKLKEYLKVYEELINE